MLADGPHGRRLTAAEQRELDDLEQRLLAADPTARPGPAPTASTGSSATGAGRRAPRKALVVGIIGLGLACGLLVLAGIVGGPGAAAATAVALLATLAAIRLVGRRSRRGRR